MRSEIVDAMDAASRDPAVRVVVVTGDPAGKCFCAGADLSGGGEKAFGKGDSVMEGDIPAGRPVNNSTWRDGGGDGRPVSCSMHEADYRGYQWACCRRWHHISVGV
jgi:hypothetical protein